MVCDLAVAMRSEVEQRCEHGYSLDCHGPDKLQMLHRNESLILVNETCDMPI